MRREERAMKLLRQDKGTVFISTMISMLLMTLVSGYIFQVTNQDMRFVTQLQRSLQAQYLAEAGLAKAVAVLYNDWDEKTNAAAFPSTALDQGTFDATVTQVGAGPSSRWKVSCVGTVDAVQRTASCEVSGPTQSALDYILAGGSNIDLKLTAKSTCDITGDIYATNLIEMRAIASQAEIEIHDAGDVYCGGSIMNYGGDISYNSLNADYPNLVGFPTFNFAYYQTIAQTNSFYYATSQIWDSGDVPVNPTGGVIFVNGDLTITDTNATTAAIIVTGSVEITQGTLTINRYLDYPALMTQTGNITIRSVGAAAQGSLVATGLVYAAGNFSLSGNHNSAIVTGSILARGTLIESGTWCSLTMVYEEQNPPGMLSSGAETVVVRSYNT